jgi:predicted  nucleic acid-binding Zn-ribbon protein
LELGDATFASRLRRLGLEVAGPQALTTRRAALVNRLDARWRQNYERALRRYGAGVAAVRGRVCQGCFMTLPRSAAAVLVDGISTCEACGRILYWDARVTVDSD